MSVIIAITPILISAAWPLVAAAAAAALSEYGYRETESAPLAETTCVEVALEKNAELAAAVGRGESKTFVNGDMTVALRRDGRGNLSLRIDGKGKSARELEALGREMVGRIVQQYAYQRITAEMGNKGYGTVNEEKAADGTIRLTLRRWS